MLVDIDRYVFYSLSFHKKCRENCQEALGMSWSSPLATYVAYTQCQCAYCACVVCVCYMCVARCACAARWVRRGDNVRQSPVRPGHVSQLAALPLFPISLHSIYFFCQLYYSFCCLPFSFYFSFHFFWLCWWWHWHCHGRANGVVIPSARNVPHLRRVALCPNLWGANTQSWPAQRQPESKCASDWLGLAISAWFWQRFFAGEAAKATLRWFLPSAWCGIYRGGS